MKDWAAKKRAEIAAAIKPKETNFEHPVGFSSFLRRHNRTLFDQNHAMINNVGIQPSVNGVVQPGIGNFDFLKGDVARKVDGHIAARNFGIQQEADHASFHILDRPHFTTFRH